MFLLCTYVDSERWASAVEPLLYPTGVTFYRPFSYRKEYFVPSQLGEQLADPSQVRVLLKTPSWNEVIFGVRFRDRGEPDFRPFFVPLRKATLIESEKPDELNIRFTLGGFIQPVQVQGGEKRLPRLDITSIVGDVGAVKLFLQVTEPQKEQAQAWAFTPNFPPDFWDAFVNSLSVVGQLKLKDAITLRLDGLRIRGQNTPLAPVEIDHRKSTWGYRLSQGTTYDGSLYYKRLVEKGAGAKPVDYLFTLTNPEEELQSSRRTLRISGNYRSEEIWIRPQVGTPGPIDLAFEPAKVEQPMQVVDQANSKAIGLKIPVLAKDKTVTAPTVVNFLLFFLSAVGILLSLRAYFHGSPSDAYRRVLELFIAALASLAITSLKDLFIQKH